MLIKTGDQAGDMGSLRCAGQDQTKIIGSIRNDKDFAIERRVIVTIASYVTHDFRFIFLTMIV